MTSLVTTTRGVYKTPCSSEVVYGHSGPFVSKSGHPESACSHGTFEVVITCSPSFFMTELIASVFSKVTVRSCSTMQV